ncbi:MAG: cytosine permease [Pseudomonadota bacterium]
MQGEPGQEYATSPVPEAETVSGWQVGFVIIGIAITLPGLYSGGEIAQALGLSKALLALIFASAVLSIMSIPTAILGQRKRLTSYALIKGVFGPAGGTVINAIFGLILIGWYAVTADLFGRTLHTGLEDSLGLAISTPLLTIVSSALVIVTTLYGFKAIDRLATVAVPLLFLVIAYVSARHILDGFDPGPQTSAGSPHGASFTWAVNAVIGAMIVNVVLMPDLSRYARTRGDAILAAVMGNGLGSVVAMALAMIPALATGQLDPMAYMLSAGLGIAALSILVAATWTTNSVNLYSTGLVAGAVLQTEQFRRMVAVAGILGTAAALAGFADYLIDFLIILGILVPPVAGVYLVHHFILGEDIPFHGAACLSAGTATALGMMSYFTLLPTGFSSSIAALDTLLLGAGLYWGTVQLLRRRAAA